MSNIQEKIDGFVNVYCDGYSPSAKGVARNMLRSIATQAVEEYKKELLEKLPKPANIKDDHGLFFDEMGGFNECLSQVKSLINKSN